MAAPVAELRTELSASVARFKNDFKAAQKTVRSSTKGMGNSFKGLSKSSSGLASSIFTLKGGLALLAGAILTKSIAKFTEFEKGLREVGTLMGGLTDREIKGMSEEIKLLAIQSGQAIDKLVKARYDIVSAGFTDAASSAELLRVAADLAVGGVSDVATTADLLTTAINAYGLEAEDAAEVSDKLFTIVRLGKTTVTELSGSMGRLLAIAATMNVDLNEVGAALATLTANGQKTEEAVTAIRAAIVEFSKPGKELAEALKSVGIASGEALIKEKGLEGALVAVNEAAIKNNTSIIQLLSNVRSMQAVLPLATTAANEFKNKLEEFGNTADATADAVAEVQKAADFQFQRFGRAMDIVGLKIGTVAEIGGMAAGEIADFIENIQILAARASAVEDPLLSTAQAIDFFGLQLLQGAITQAQYTASVDALRLAEESAAAATEILALRFGESNDVIADAVDITDEELDALIALEDEAIHLAAAEARLTDEMIANNAVLRAQERAARNADAALQNTQRTIEGLIESMLRGVASGRKFSDVLLDIGKSLAIKGIAKLIGAAIGTVVAPGTGTVVGAEIAGSFAAKGGIVGGPTLLATPNGPVTAGEAGEEGILPLARVGGVLGVQSTGGGGTPDIRNSYNFNGPTNKEFIQNEVIPMIEESSRAQSTSITTLRDFDQGDAGLELKRAPQ